MERSPFLPLPEGMVMGQIQVSEAQLTVEVISTLPSAVCPGCGCSSEQVHSRYQRTVHDTPCAGRRVVLQLCVRKFFCRISSCQRKVFTERLPDLVQPWARVSNRLLAEVKAIGLTALAEVSERLAPQLGMKAKAPTLLRYLRTVPDPVETPVEVLGRDDFAMRRGDCYGTILVNLETHRPLDLLPNRTAEAVLPWLQSHSDIDVVSRDRASAYADAAKRALPHAIQVADRYHLTQNLREHIQKFLDQKQKLLPLVKDTPLKQVKAPETESSASALVVTPLVRPGSDMKTKVSEISRNTQQRKQPLPPHQMDIPLSSLTYAERQKKISRDKRYARYLEVTALHQAGMAQRAIARQLGVSRKVVTHFVSSPVFPERAAGSGQRARSHSKLDAFLPYLRERGPEGIHKSSQLFREIQERGFTGSESLVRHTLAEWRAEMPPKPRQGPKRLQRLVSAEASRRLSSRSASFLMILSPQKLTAAKRQQVEQICAASPELHTVYLLSQDFVTMLRERRAEALDEWLERAKESHIRELISFANGISKDYAAVRAACELETSNGITEGHVNRLKFLKRQMFGRANLDLLRVKVLHAV